MQVKQPRGTEWANRPVLSSQPTLLEGPGTLTNSYANSEPLCTDDLSMGSSTCAGKWNDAYGPENLGAQMRMRWATPLAPGAGVSIGFAMKTPLDVPQVSSPTTAWNSYAPNETTLRANGREEILRP